MIYVYNKVVKYLIEIEGGLLPIVFNERELE